MGRFLNRFWDAPAVAPAPATFDFTAGGLIPAENCIQAFDPWAASSLAASYIDLSGNGHNAVVTTPPTLGNGGWVFNGVDQFVDTGVIALYTYTIAITYTAVDPDNRSVVAGNDDGMVIFPLRYGVRRYYWGGVGLSSEGDELSGNCIVSGQDLGGGYYGKAFWNGVTDIEFEEDPYEGSGTLYIGANNDGGSADDFCPAVVSRWAVYNIALTDDQAAALAAAMAVS